MEKAERDRIEKDAFEIELDSVKEEDSSSSEEEGDSERSMSNKTNLMLMNNPETILELSNEDVEDHKNDRKLTRA